MEKKLEKLTTQLVALSKCADNSGLLFEEIQVIQDKAFKAQDEIMQILEQMEKEATEISTLQNIFQIRETVWDIMGKLADREQQIKATKDKKAPKTKGKSGHCSCCHHDHHKECCCQHTQCNKHSKGKTCKKK